jgi:hypothetical protein
MSKSLIAGLTALALAFTPASPVAAQTYDQDAIGKMLFGLVAALAVGKMIDSAQSDNNVAKAKPVQALPHQPPVVSHTPQTRPIYDRGGLKGYAPPVVQQPRSALGSHGSNGFTGWSPPRPRANESRANPVLPAACLYPITGPYGRTRILSLRCLDAHSKVAAKLPPACFIQVPGRNGIRRGFNPSCLRGAGYRFH